MAEGDTLGGILDARRGELGLVDQIARSLAGLVREADGLILELVHLEIHSVLQSLESSPCAPRSRREAPR